MNFRLVLVVACAGLVLTDMAVLSASPAHARAWRKVPVHCIDRPYQFSLKRFLFNPKPQPNGCAPPVYQGGEYIGQDPDLNIRFQLLRDPDTGYTQQH